MKSAEYKKITELVGKLGNNLVNLDIDYGLENKKWGRIEIILKELEKDSEKLSKVLRAARIGARDKFENVKREGKLK